MEDVVFDVEDSIGIVRLDRPDVYNAFRPQTITELNDTLRSARDLDSLIVTGSGEGFCAGGDLNVDRGEMSEAEYTDHLRAVQETIVRLREFPRPTVAAINGPAIGAGCDIALSCDLRTISRDAFLREGFVRVGLVPADGGGWLLPRLIGEAKAKEYLLTGKDMSPETASELGLVTEISDEPLESAREIAATSLGHPKKAVKHTKELINSDVTLAEYFDRAVEYQWECINDPEHQEAIAEFREEG